MTARHPVAPALRGLSAVGRTIRRIARQLERRLRYRWLGWV